MQAVFVKRCPDPYSLSRESQALDLLGQMGAPVPKVLSVDVLALELRMEHVGEDLAAWLQRVGPTPASERQATRLLAEAAGAVVRLCDMGFFHLDLAARNVLVGQDPELPGSVRLADFGLAVTPRFPAQKPLWIRPDRETQHPDLYQAIVEDWSAFFRRHALPLPDRWDTDFEIPMGIYQEDWAGSTMAVDRLRDPWSVVAHGLGKMIEECTARGVFGLHTQAALIREARQVLDLGQPAEGEARLRAAARRLDLLAEGATPRPSPKAPEPAVPPAVTAQAQAQRTSGPSAPTAPTSPSDDPVQAPVSPPGTSTAPVGSPGDRAAPGWGRLTLALVATVAGFVVVDAGYLAYGARISPFTLGVILANLSLTFAIALRLVLRRGLRQHLGWAGLVQGLTLVTLAAELVYTADAVKAGGIALALAAVVLLCSRKK